MLFRSDFADGVDVRDAENFLHVQKPLSSASRVPLHKRMFDRVFAALALVFFLPFFLLISAVILVTDGRPVFFVQERIGRNGRPFRCFKFRTMVHDAEERLHDLLQADPEARREWEVSRKLTDDPRIHCIGALLRRTSLDELPQFLNVLRGEMSVVGPRPILMEEVAYYGPHFHDYASTLPGVTGAWQVSGRSDTTFAERVALDVEYVRNWSFLRDLKIVMRTVAVVLRQHGAR